MIIVDRELSRRAAAGKPIRVALVGAGYMGRCIALQILTAVAGMRLVAIANRSLARAAQAYREGGVEDVATASSAAELERLIELGHCAITDDPRIVCAAGQVDAVIETTGDVEFGARACLEAIAHGKHVILMNAEVDASVGPILKVRADRAGVVYTYTDGDEPGIGMNLYRLLDSMGYRPVLMGQMKGMLDRYRNPDTQAEFAARHAQNAAMVASFADGSKMALEAAIMGNATGFVPQTRGMKGYPCAHVNDLLQCFKPEDFAGGGLVDFALGAAPHTGAFVMAFNDDARKRQLMGYLKMGSGPLYLLYTPYHLPPWQIVHSVARAVLFQDATVTPRGAPVCDTIAHAKRDLKAGERLDGMGGFTCYGLVERYATCRRADYLPMAISVDCVLNRAIAKDQPLRYADVKLPPDRTCDRLRDEQTRHFPVVGAEVTA